MKRLALVTGASVLAVALLVLTVHTPPVRRLVLRYVIAEVQRRYAIRIEAARLDYNLASLTLGLAQVRVAANRTPEVSFFEADYVRAVLASRTLTGAVAFDEIAATNGRVQVVRDASGGTNLPESSETPSGEPAALDVARISAPRLVIDIRDAQNDLALAIPGLTMDIRRNDGRVTLNAPATVRVGPKQTRVQALDGGTSFDGRALVLRAVAVKADEASLILDGTVSLLVRDPAVDLHATGTADVERLASWAVSQQPLPRGAIALDVRANGPFAAPVADVVLKSSRLDWNRVSLTDVMVESHVTNARAELRRADFSIARGRVSAQGEMPFGAEADARLGASWSGIDATALANLAGPADIEPSGTLSGDMDFMGPVAQMSRWTANVRLHADGGMTGKGRIAAPGDTRLRITDGQWRVEARHRAGGTVPLALVAGGVLNATAIGNSTLTGRLEVPETTVPQLVRFVRAAGIADVGDDVISEGTVSAAVMLSGRLSRPTIDGSIHALDLAGMQVRVGELRATASGDVTARRLSFAADVPSIVAVDQEVTDVRLDGALNGNALTVEMLSAAQPAGSGQLSLSGTYNLQTEQYDGRLHVARWAITATADRPLATEVDATFTGSGSISQPYGMGSLHLSNVTWSGTSYGDLAGDVKLDGETASIDARAPALKSSLGARVGTKAPYQTTADLHVDALDLTKLIPPGSSPTPLVAQITASGHAQGALSTWREAIGLVEIPMFTAGTPDLQLRGMAQVRYVDERVFVTAMATTGSGTAISVNGELPAFPDSRIHTGVDPSLVQAQDREGIFLVADSNKLQEIVDAVNSTGLAQVPITEGSASLGLRARLTGSLEKPLLTADFGIGPGSVTITGFSTATDVMIGAHFERDVIDVRSAHVVYEGAVLDGRGSIPLAVVGLAAPPSSALPASLHVTANNVTPAVLRGVLDPITLEDFTGVVDVAVNVDTPSMDASQVTGDVTLTRLELQMAGLPVTQASPTRIVAKDGFARIESWNWSGQGATLGVFGQVRLADRQAAIIANGDIDLRVLTPFVRSTGMSTAGRLTPRLSITGSLDDPRIDGDMVLADGEVRMIDPRVIVTGLNARASLTRTDMTLRSLNGSLNGGALTGSGSVAYDADSGITAQLAADVRDMALDFPAGLRSELDAMLQLDARAPPGEAAPSGRLTGSITVSRAAYREPLAVVGGLLTALRARRVAATGGAPDGGSAFLKQLALDIRVVTDEDVVVDNNYARAQLGGDLNLIGTAAAPAMSGRAVLREDGQLFVGRNVYTISRDTPSTIDFVSPTAIEPELNIHLRTRVSGHDIELALTGPAESPQVDMSSEDLGQADITALLLTGRTLDQLGTADASFIGTQVIGNFSGEVLGFAGRAVGLDTLRLGGVEDSGTRLDPNAVATEVDPTSRLTFGKSLGPNVDVTFSQSLRDSTAQTWIVEYLPARQLDLRLVSGDNDLRSYGFRHDVSFGGGTSAGPSRPATERRAEQRIAQVNISGDLAFPEERIRSLLKLRAGDTFDFGRWQDDRDRLEDFYHRNGHLAARVNASRETNGDVVNLVYVIDGGPQTSVDVRGIDLGNAVLQRLRDAWATSILDELLIEEATQVVRSELSLRGYVRPAVSARVTIEGNTKTLHIAVQPGERSSETRVRIATSDEVLAMDLDRRVAERGLAALVLRDPGAVTRDLTEYLRSRGYLRATVKPAPALIEGTVAVLPITVDPGPQFVIANIEFEGRRSVDSEDVQSAAAIMPAAPYDPVAIDAARERIVGVYRSRGFVSTSVIANAAVRDADARVDLTFEITEGARQTIGDIVVSGSSGVDTDVVTRALRLTIGTPLEPAELLRARTRIFDTGLFRRVDVTTEPMNRVSASDPVQPMRIRVALEAWPALRLRYGFQATEEYSSSVPSQRRVAPGLAADVTRRTLFGRAVSLAGAVQYQRRERSARALLSAPTMLTLPVQSSLVLERSHREPAGSDLVTDMNSVSWEQRLRAAQHFTFSYSYRFDRDHTFVTKPDPITGINFNITVNVARLIGNVAWDTRNDPLDASRGSLYSSSLQWAPDSLGSQFRFVKYVGQAYRFEDIHGVVLASAARLGLVRALGGQELYVGERFFAGGSRTVRGVDESALGPRDFFGDPAGGEAMLVLNQEARVPVYKWLRGIAFIDAGNVFPTTRDLTFSGLAGSVGVGVRLTTPFALLRADYGKIVWGPGARTGRWVFGIGQAF